MVGIRPLSLVFLTFALVAPAGASANPTRIILKRDSGLNAAQRRDIRTDAGVRLVETLGLPRTEVVAASAGEAGDALRALRSDDDVVYAELDRKRSVNSDPYMSWLWGLDNSGQNVFGEGTSDADIDAVEAWQLEAAPAVPISGAGVTVAVVDSGIDATHEDLDGQVGLQYNFVGTDSSDATDTTGHGTHVSGTIAAARNDTGIVGVAPEATLMALRAIGDDGQGLDSDIAEAFRYAGEHDVRVVNASLGGSGSSQTLDAAIHEYPNTLFVASAGNGGADEVGDDNDAANVWPCNSPEPNVLCVGASTNTDLRATFSNYGAHTVDLFAPGQSILSTVPEDVVILPDFPNQKYLFFDGTSMAAPHVSGAAALVLQAKPELTPVEVKSVLMQKGDYKAAFGGRSVSGRRLNADAAVRLALSTGPLPDRDSDGVADATDGCRTIPSSDLSNGCPDRDRDGVTDGSDNCPSVPNKGQENSDRRNDGGDACDSDFDNDGKGNSLDACPKTYGSGADGCPVVITPAGDRDHDGHVDASDGCPNEPAATLDGCPLPAVTALSTKSRKRRATITVRTSRAATVKITVQRKRGRRWVRAARKTLVTSANRVTLRTKRLRRGRYRAVVVLSSSAGRTAALTRRFRVR
jgi:subtilisin family serine protease